MVSGQRRVAGDGTGPGAGARVVAGVGDGCESWTGTGLGADAVELDARRDSASAEHGIAAGASGAAFAARHACSFPEKKLAAVEGAVVCGSTGYAERQSDEPDRGTGINRATASAATACGGQISMVPSMTLLRAARLRYASASPG